MHYPFTTEARFSVLNAIAFSTEKRASVVEGLKHHFASWKNDLIFWSLVVLGRHFSWNCFKNNSIFFFCYPLEVIFIYYKSRIATAIRGLWWMKMTMVNSGGKGLTSIGSCNVWAGFSARFCWCITDCFTLCVTWLWQTRKGVCDHFHILFCYWTTCWDNTHV